MTRPERVLGLAPTFWLAAGATTAAVLTLVGVSLMVIGLLHIKSYRISSGGMSPTLEKGDLILAWRPIRSIQGVRRGQVVVYQHESYGKVYNMVWRVVGLPGDVVQIGVAGVEINGVELAQQALGERVGRRFMRETSGELRYDVSYDLDDRRKASDPTVVPEGQLFVMGDNRSHSFDSEDSGPIWFTTVKGRLLWTSRTPLELLR